MHSAWHITWNASATFRISNNDSRSQELNCSHHSLVFVGLQSSSIYIVKILVGNYTRSGDYCIYQNSSKPYKTEDEKSTSPWTTETISIIVGLGVVVAALVIIGLPIMFCKFIITVLYIRVIIGNTQAK